MAESHPAAVIVLGAFQVEALRQAAPCQVELMCQVSKCEFDSGIELSYPCQVGRPYRVAHFVEQGSQYSQEVDYTAQGDLCVLVSMRLLLNHIAAGLSFSHLGSCTLQTRGGDKLWRELQFNVRPGRRIVVELSRATLVWRKCATAGS